MNFKIFIIMLLICIKSISLFAEDTFNNEFNFGFQRRIDNFKMETWGYIHCIPLEYTRYFSEIEQSETQPFLELPFLNKASYFSIVSNNIRYEDKDSNEKVLTPGVGFIFKYVFKEIPLFLGLSYYYFDDYYDTGGGDDIDHKLNSKNVNTLIGLYLLDNLSMQINFGYEKIKFNYFHISHDSYGRYSGSVKEYTFGGNIKLVQYINDNIYVNLEADYLRKSEKWEYQDADNDEGSLVLGDTFAEDRVNHKFSFLFDFYFFSRLGLGAGVKLYRGDLKRKEGVEYLFRTSYFFTNSFSLKISYDKFKVKDSDYGEDGNGFDCSLSFRF